MRFHSFKMAFQLAPIGGVFSSVVLVPVWVNNELISVIVMMYLLSMPLPPYVGTMRVGIHHSFDKIVDNCFDKIC